MTTPQPAAPASVPLGEDDVLVQVENLVKYFPIRGPGLLARTVGHVQAVDGVSLTLHRGQTLGLVGETGSGKTTLARCIAGLIPITSGSVVFDGHEIAGLSRRAMRPFRREIQMIFQDPYGSLNPRRRVGSIIGDPFAVHRTASGAARKRAVQDIMERVGLNPEHFNRFPAEFSGGQRQRIGLARALTLNPSVIVADEPVSALDVSIRAQVLNLMKRLQADHGLTYVVISHDLAVVKYMADHIGVMYLGKLVELAPASEIYEKAAHPYTAGLISAIPEPEPSVGGTKREVGVAGELPSAINPPSGCRFRTRCPLAQEICVAEEPQLRSFGPGHVAACHFPLQALAPIPAEATSPASSR